MPNQMSNYRECHSHLLGHSENLSEWENEGGSVSGLPATAGSERIQRAVRLESESALLDALPVGTLITALDGVITYSNPACQKMYGTSESNLVGTHWTHILDARDRAGILARWYETSSEQKPLVFDVRMTVASGKWIWTRHSIARLSADLSADGYIHTIEDITTIKNSERAVTAATEALSWERERARVTLECIGDAVISTDAAGRVTYLNAVAEELTGWTREAACGQSFGAVFRVVDTDSGLPVCNPADRAMQGREVVQIPPNCLLLKPDGSKLAIEDSAAPIIDADGRLVGAVVVFRDQSMSKQNVVKMAYLARHDALTGLPNRAAFSEHFAQAIHLARRHQNQVGVLFIDLDNFKQINDSLGHKVGDRLLKDLSRRLASCMRSTDLFCRHGGDEFVVLLSEIRQPEDAGSVAGKIHKAVARPFHIHGHAISMVLSIGISVYPEDGTSMESLIHKADAAMYQAKLDAGTRHCFYEAGMQRPMVGHRFENLANAFNRIDSVG